MRVLLVEDEKRMAQALCEMLRRENYAVDCRYDGLSGLEAAESGVYDVIVLDVMLPKMNGFEITEDLRKSGLQTPILMLTAKAELDDKVKGLDSGADDYLTKPFMAKELLARIRALLRRNIDTPDGKLKFGDVFLDSDTYELYCETTGQNIRLSEKEKLILEYLIANQNRILTREQLAVKIWGYESDAEYNNVEVYMSFTRKKLAFVGAKTKIKAIRGVGYELRCEDVQENKA